MLNSDCIAIKDIKPGLKNINVIFIVLDIGSATVTKENREVRNFKVGDHTASINVSIWDEPGKLIVPGDIIKLTKGYASIWRHCLTLYSGKNGEVYKIGEFCMTFNETVNMSEPKRTEQPATAQQQQPAQQLTANGNNTPNAPSTGNSGNNSRALTAHTNKTVTPHIATGNAGTGNNNAHTPQKALGTTSATHVSIGTNASAIVSNPTIVGSSPTNSSIVTVSSTTISQHKITARNPRSNLTRATNSKSDRR